MGADDRLDLRAEQQGVVGLAVVERLDAERIAGEMEQPVPAVVESEGEHAAQPLQHAHQPVGEIAVENDLAIAPGSRPGAPCLEVPTQLLMVVDLTVEDQGGPTIMILERVVAAFDVDDRQAPMAEAEAPVDHAGLGIRTPMGEKAGHALQRRGVQQPAFRFRREARNTTHVEDPPG